MKTYYEVYWYENANHEYWSSQGFRTQKDAISFVKAYKNIFFDFEITKRDVNGNVLRYVK